MHNLLAEQRFFKGKLLDVTLSLIFVGFLSLDTRLNDGVIVTDSLTFLKSHRQS